MSEQFLRCRLRDGTKHYGRVAGEKIALYDAAPWCSGKPSGLQVDRSAVAVLAPVEPSKIVCVGLNYHAHVQASFSADTAPSQPLIFLKPPSSIIGPGEPIRLPEASQRVDYEAELGLVIAQQARHVAVERAEAFIFGYTCVNDVTARDLQKSDGQWSRAKGFDSFCPVGPVVATGLQYDQLRVQGIHNGQTRQDGLTSRMIFSVPFLISYISGIMTLEPGDLLITGTPAGIAPMQSGDTITVRIEPIGDLTNPVV